jgi:hypothetical protein
MAEGAITGAARRDGVSAQIRSCDVFGTALDASGRGERGW